MDFLAKTTDEITDLEIRHSNTVRELAGECMVLLENEGGLPIRNPGRIALYGNGARHTVKGGGGSGEVKYQSVTDLKMRVFPLLQRAGWTDMTRYMIQALRLI